MLTPHTALADLQSYIQAFEMTLSEEAERIVLSVERIALENDRVVHDWTFLAGLLAAYAPLRSAMIRAGGNPIGALEQTLSRVREDGDSYQVDAAYPPYSDVDRGLTTRTVVVDLAISIARRNHRSEILGADMLEALIDYYDREYPFQQNDGRGDEALHTPYNTLAHITGIYHPALWVRFSDLRREIGLQGSPVSDLSPAETAPPEIRAATLMLLDEYPDFVRNCFLIMPFRDTPVHSAIQDAVRDILRGAGFNVLRADDRVYSEDVFANIQAYMHSCRFGVAVFERTLSDEFNPNVSLEVGYMLGQGKPVMLLKEQTVRQLQSDLVGRLYVNFDGMQVAESLRPGMLKWLSDRRLK